MRESYRQQERFVPDASHEPRTPISVIQGYVNTLDRWGKDDPKILDESIEALKNESEHMKLLIEQLLFGLGRQRQKYSASREFDLAAMVREVWEESAMIDEDTTTNLKGMTHCLSSGIRRFSSSRCGFWFRMLPSTPEKGGRILLKSKGGGRPSRFYRSDEGMGMAESEVIHAFERFYRSEGARNRTEGGTGLGLSIARWIVDAHGGTIEVCPDRSSEPGLP